MCIFVFLSFIVFLSMSVFIITILFGSSLHPSLCLSLYLSVSSFLSIHIFPSPSLFCGLLFCICFVPFALSLFSISVCFSRSPSLPLIYFLSCHPSVFPSLHVMFFSLLLSLSLCFSHCVYCFCQISLSFLRWISFFSRSDLAVSHCSWCFHFSRNPFFFFLSHFCHSHHLSVFSFSSPHFSLFYLSLNLPVFVSHSLAFSLLHLLLLLFNMFFTLLSLSSFS